MQTAPTTSPKTDLSDVTLEGAPGGARKEEARQPNTKLIEDPTYRPYCLMCSTMGRMTRTSFGFVCHGEGDHFGRIGCGNEIGVDFTHWSVPRTNVAGQE